MNVTPAAMRGAKPIPPKPAFHDSSNIIIPEPLLTPPTPPPAHEEQRRHVPLYGPQYVRREAIRLAIDSYRDEDRPTDDQIIATADRIAEFIRTGNTKGTQT